MATAPTYITHAELKRIFPQMDEFDQDTPIYISTLVLWVAVVVPKNPL